jgi:hypothetical protein
LAQVTNDPLLSSEITSVAQFSGKKSSVSLELEKEEWFHGPISRKDSENLVVKDGDFLVRESQGSAGQYVLTGMQGGIRKHLLLVDPEGVVSICLLKLKFLIILLLILIVVFGLFFKGSNER